jgi:hypothetical protein
MDKKREKIIQAEIEAEDHVPERDDASEEHPAPDAETGTSSEPRNRRR